MMSQAIAVVRLSYGRAIAKPTFLDRFYEILMASSPAVARMFAKTDLARQQELLAQAVNMVILFPQGNKIATNAITRIRDSHCREKLNISPEYYQLWLDSLLKTVAEHDADFNESLEKSWREVASAAIDYIIEGY